MKHTEGRAGSMDIGVLCAVICLSIAFETIPGASIGRLASNTTAEEMVGVDAGELYEIPPEIPEEVNIDIQEIAQNEIPEVVQSLTIISLTEDTTGLSTALTVSTNIEHSQNTSNEIPVPGTFVPHSIPPICTYRPMPEYPEMARQAGVEGRVILQVFISETGEPVEIMVIQSSGLSSMDNASEIALLDSRWTPAERNDGVAVGVWTSVIYEFVLE